MVVVIDVMPRERDPRRDEAKRLWLESGGEADLISIAEQLAVSPGTVRGWKSKDDWNGALPNERNAEKGTERSLPLPEPKVTNDELPERQRVFVLEYMRDFNATRAALAAGYSKRSAYTEGWRLLKKAEIRAEINRMKEMYAAEFGLDIRRVIAEYMKIAFADITDLMDFGRREVPVTDNEGNVIKDDEGNPIMTTENYVVLRNSDEIDGAVISEVKQGRTGVSVKMHDRIRALERLERYLDFMTEEEKLRIQKLQAEIKQIEEKGW